MTTIEFWSEAYTIPLDSDGDVLDKPASCKLTFDDCTPGLGFDSLESEPYILRGSLNRTIEGRLSRDVVSTFRTWEIGWDNIPANLYYEIIDFFKNQCDENHCLKMNIIVECGDQTDCDKKNVTGVSVDVELGNSKLDDSIGTYNDFSLTVKESANDDCGCGGA